MEFVKIMILLMAVVMPIIHSLPTQTTPSELQDGAEGNTNSRKKRCGHGGSDTTTTTEKFRDWDFEHPPKEGDPADPIHKDNRLLPQKRDIKNERGRGQVAMLKEVLSSLLNIVRHTPRPGSLIFRERRSADEDDNKSKSNDEEAASLQ
ncbi:uncharacterized protein LOC126553688 [Aphis gossypii]|uniref:uncharacterized protein LOC126553688 n=1 Tax=Aphis gossypii TaxID=80765 RepID=UPI002158CFEA|nr:uncharacterized protein LOC126553688 [Aphis gossypii]